MVCAAAAEGTKEHARHYCAECMYGDIDYTESPCDFCNVDPDKCAWTPKED